MTHARSLSWQAMVEAAKRGAEKAGFNLQRLPGRGLSNVWIAAKRGDRKRVSIRTTKNRWIAFPPLEGGARWKTLDDVDLVIVAAVNDKDNPQTVEVYIFDAVDLRKRFKEAYAARRKAGQSIQDDFGMWVNLDRDDRNLPASAGSGVVEKYKPVAHYSIDSLPTKEPAVIEQAECSHDAEGSRPATIASVLADARVRIAGLAGVEIDSVKLELKIEY